MRGALQPGRGRELAALALGAGAAAALVWAAFASVEGTELAGEVALARRAGEVADDLQAEWERLLRAREAPAPARGKRFAWSVDEVLPSAGPPVTDVSPTGRVSSSVLATLLSEAERLELEEGRPAEALGEVLAGLERDPDSEWKPEARLRAIQLATRLGRGQVVGEQWSALEAELGWDAARGGTSYLLLAALAAAPGWSHEQRAAVQARIADAWTEGTLAVPAGEPEVVQETTGESAVRVAFPSRALLERTVSMAQGPGLAPLGEVERRAALRALERALGERPAPPDDRRWYVTATVFGPLLARRSADGAVAAHFALLSDLRDALERAGTLPDGFALELVGGAAAPGELVREAAELPGTPLLFRLRHAEPERITGAARERASGLRAALLLLAALFVVASVVTARALARERRLAALKTSFIAGVSHDLRTPLASILLMAENLQEGRVRAGGEARYYGAIRREADRLRRLVDDVLDFSRLERGERAKIAREDVALEPFLTGLASEARERVERAGARFVYETDGLPPSAALDVDAVRRAVWNLVDNAVTHSGSDAVTLGARAENGALLLSVTDRGRGVPAARREEIFRPFAQLGPEGEGGRGEIGAAGGTGLGLAIVREVARAHGGDARVVDGPHGAGATFELRLALEDGPLEGTT